MKVFHFYLCEKFERLGEVPSKELERNITEIHGWWQQSMQKYLFGFLNSKSVDHVVSCRIHRCIWCVVHIYIFIGYHYLNAQNERGEHTNIRKTKRWWLIDQFYERTQYNVTKTKSQKQQTKQQQQQAH